MRRIRHIMRFFSEKGDFIMDYAQRVSLHLELFDNKTTNLLERLPDGDTIYAVWVKLVCFAAKANNDGFLSLFGTPLTTEDLAQIFRRPLTDVKKAVMFFLSQGLLEKADGALHIIKKQVFDFSQFRQR